METGLLEALRAYAASDALPMHMPGHKRNRERFPWLVGCELDITEIEGFDNLNEPRGIFRDLSGRMASMWGADRSFPLVNGSTGGILAAIYTCLSGGGSALVARGCHRSVYHGCEITGASVDYLLPEADERGVWQSVTPESVSRALDRGNYSLVVVTSPTYEGVISDIESIAKVCHRRGVPLLVDEAHGAHLGFGGFPRGAVRCGADMVVQSLHKTLPSPTQTAVLHVTGELVSPDKLARAVAIFQSSSPSYPLLAGIDGCVRFMEREGESAMARWLSLLDEVESRAESLRLLRLLYRRSGKGIYSFDPSKIVITAEDAGLTGPELMEVLRDKYHIELEMAAGSFAVAMTGPGDTEGTIGRFLAALRCLDSTLAPARSENVCRIRPALPAKALSLADAVLRPGVLLPIGDARGQISAEYVWAYPPGVPLVVPGEVIDGELLELIDAETRSNVVLHSSFGAVPRRIFCVSA